MSIAEGTRLGRYKIQSLLGAGGMGEVFLALDAILERTLALKVLPADFANDKNRMQRFMREAKSASALNHPNILTIYEIGQHDEHHFIATEFIEGESLRQHLAHSQMGVREVLDVISQVASALAAAHQAGIVHRDIKPENIMIRRDGLVKVLDFGLAKSVNAAPEATDPEAPTMTRIIKTDPGVVMGTAHYMSPEQARGLAVDERTDIWSLGVVLYELVAGRLPFEGPTMSDVIATILHHEPPSLLLYSPDLPAELERIVEKALTKDREERYQLAKELNVDVKRLRQHLEIESELERSITPDEGVRRAARQTASRELLNSGLNANQTASGNATSTLSSAEYIVGEIKRHKGSALVGLITVVIAIAASFAYFLYARGDSETISSIAVLPFTNASGDANMEYLSDGLSESLINALSQLPQLKVIARSSAFQYKGKEMDLQEVAKALGVQAIVTGRVVQRGDSLQVSAEMVDARDKTQLWGEQYSRNASDLQAVQQEIARTISEKLRVRLSGAEAEQFAKPATANAEAYQLYLNGMFYRRKGGFENGKKALNYHQQAVALDPNFALALTGVADAYRYLVVNSVVDPKEVLPKAKAAVQKALQLDEQLPEAHVVLGMLSTDEWNWDQTEREFKRAIELNPNLAEARFRYQQFLTQMGRYPEALAEIKRAQELDPLRITFKAEEGIIMYNSRHFEEAIKEFQDVLKLEPNYTLAYIYLGYTYSIMGSYGEALRAYEKVIQIEGSSTSLLCYMSYALAKSGKRNEALAIVEKLKYTNEYVSPTEMAVAYVGLGDKEAALASLEKGLAAHDPQMGLLKVELHFDSLQSEPRFQELMRKVRLP